MKLRKEPMVILKYWWSIDATWLIVFTVRRLDFCAIAHIATIYFWFNVHQAFAYKRWFFRLTASPKSGHENTVYLTQKDAL